MKAFIIILLAGLAGFFLAAAQTVTYSTIPVTYQLVPRDASDSGMAVVSGTVTGLGYDSVVVDVRKGASAYQRAKTVLAYSGTTAPFSLSIRLSSELAEYQFRVYGNTTLLRSVDSVVCGDVYVVNGQSNAEASAGTNIYDAEIGEWVRSTGYSGNLAVWAKASYTCCFGNGGGASNGPEGAGILGANLGRLIATAYQTPVAIINGAYSGTVIEQHLPNASNHADIATIYGRVLRRAQVAGVVNDIKAILWYQGEYHNGYATYPGLFDQLYQAWKADFPGIRKVYVEQINTGCDTTVNANIREIQRKFPETYADITVMTACGIMGYTGCHYTTGYPHIAQWWTPVFGRDFYGQTTPNVTSPRIISASFTSAAHTALDITFDMPVIWPADSLGYRMKDYVTLGASYGIIDSTRLFGNALRLYLSAASNATTVSYIPRAYYWNNPNSIYMGPYIRSSRGVGALTFLNFPITAGSSFEADARNPALQAPLSVSPNPVTPSTRICIPGNWPGKNMTLRVYSATGKLVADLSEKARRSNTTEWNAAGLPSGIYLVRFTADGLVRETKAALMK